MISNICSIYLFQSFFLFQCYWAHRNLQNFSPWAESCYVFTPSCLPPLPAQQWAGEAVISVGNDIHQHAVCCTCLEETFSEWLCLLIHNILGLHGNGWIMSIKLGTISDLLCIMFNYPSQSIKLHLDLLLILHNISGNITEIFRLDRSFSTHNVSWSCPPPRPRAKEWAKHNTQQGTTIFC